MKTAILRMHSRAVFSSGLAMLALASAFAAPAVAAPQSGTYNIVLAAPLSEARREIIGGTVWRCQADRCSAPADGERIASLCRSVARKFGAIARFATPQSELSADELLRCNKS
jgi:hypothetical protein